MLRKKKEPGEPTNKELWRQMGFGGSDTKRPELTEVEMAHCHQLAAEKEVHTQRLLLNEVYTCLCRTKWTALGPCSFIGKTIDMTGRRPDERELPYLCLGEAEGPCSILCGLPTLGAMPWHCAWHWQLFRTVPKWKDSRMQKEFRRTSKK